MSSGWKWMRLVLIITSCHYHDCTINATELFPSPEGSTRCHSLTNLENKKLTRSADIARPVGSVSEMGTESGCLDFLQRTASQQQFRCSTGKRKLASISSTKMNAFKRSTSSFNKCFHHLRLHRGRDTQKKILKLSQVWSEANSNTNLHLRLH